MKAVELSQAELEIKRRGRRRLIGAIALGLLAIVILPMVFDHEPRPTDASRATQRQEIAINIPSKDTQVALPPPVVPSTAPVTPTVPATTPTTAPSNVPTNVPAPATPDVGSANPAITPAPTSPAQAPAKVSEKGEKSTVKAVDKSAEKAVAKSEAKPAAKTETAAKASDKAGAFVVQIGAFRDADNARGIVTRLKEAKLPVFTDTVAVKSGTVTRVRVGPYASREKAEGALAEVKLAGIDGKVVSAQ